jgi:phosphate uptake regulator
MFEWLKRLDPEIRGLEKMSARFEQMLEDGRHVFDLAATALLAGGDTEVIRKDLFDTDARINRTEQEIRRQLVVHGSVHGGAVHLPELLVLMSVVKDAERIGDYAKNIYDLAARHPDLGDEDERNRLISHKDRISKVLVKTRNLYHQRDEPAALALIAEIGELEDVCDERVHSLLAVEGRNMAAPVLAFRYFKRTIAHASNIASSVVMPLDKLDYFDEPKV